MANNNWAALTALPQPLYEKVRHDYGRKLGWFDEANDTVVLTAEEAAYLRRIELGVDGIWKDLPDQVSGGIFIAVVGDQLYLVNTEGYHYCRYVAKLTIVDA